MACLSIESSVIYGNSSSTVCSNSPNIAYQQVADTNSLYTATKLYQVTCDINNYETTGYYRVNGDVRWRYWDDNALEFTNSGVCTAYSFSVQYGEYPSDVCNGSTATIYSYIETPTVGTVMYTDSGLSITWDVKPYIMFSSPTVVSISTSTGAITSMNVYTCETITTTTTLTTRPPVMEPAGMVFARSPVMFRYVSLDSDNYYKFNLYIGATDNPTTIYATIERIPDLDLGISIDVSNLLMNYMRNNFSYTAENIVYFKSDLEEWNGDTKLNTDTSSVCVATFGYNNVIDGAFNWSIAENQVMSEIIAGSPFGIPDNVSYSLPFKCDGSISYVINYTDTNGSTATITSSASGDEVARITCGYSDLPNIRKTSYITISITGGETYTLKPETCTGYDLYTIDFINKWGMWDKLFCRGRKDDNISIEYETFKFNKINYADMTYDPKTGSYHKFWTQGREKLILNTGWIDENKNEKFKQLLLSEVVLINNVPYVIVDKEARFKTDRNDKIINYTINLEKAYDAVNNVK